MISYNECVALALDVYRDEKRPKLPDGWRVFSDYKPNDANDSYFGAFYISDDQVMGPKIVFAHRGTILSVGDLVADLMIALGDTTKQYKKALDFYKSNLNDLRVWFPDYSKNIEQYISQTGHSLGSIIAELMCATLFDKLWSPMKKSVSFESPGSKPIIVSMINSGDLPKDALVVAASNCCVVQTHWDIINTCNEQVSPNNLTSLPTIPIDYNVMGGPITNVPSSYVVNYYYIAGYSFTDQHKIKHIYDHLLKGNAPYPVLDWPFGFANGYSKYKSYTDFSFYWDGYIKICWDTHPEIQDKYKDIYDDYHEFFVKEYLSDNKICKYNPGFFDNQDYVFVENPEGFSENNEKSQCIIL